MASNNDIRDLVPVVSEDFSLPRTNRFRGHEILVTNGKRFYGMWKRFVIDVAPDDQYRTVESGQDGRLDVLSFLFYGTSKLWWIIALANDIVNPFDEIPSGTVLRYPSVVSLNDTRILRIT